MGSVNTWSIDYYMSMVLCNMHIGAGIWGFRCYGGNILWALRIGYIDWSTCIWTCLVLGIARLVIFIADVIDLPAEIKGLSFRKF